MWNRIVRAALLDKSVYEEVEADKSATGQAVTLVVLVAVASGIGIGVGGDVLDLISSAAIALAAWAIGAAIVYFVGATLLPEPQTEADWGQVARTLAFAQSIGLVRILGFLPVIGGLIIFASLAWQLVAMIIAVRQALDYTSTFRAVAVILIGFIPYIIALGVLSSLLGRN
jgi:hypothetical protein